MKKLLATLLLAPLLAYAAEVTPAGLRTEHLVDPIGIDVAEPRFSWRMDDPAHATGRAQSAYHVRVASSKEGLESGQADLWDSGKVATNQSQLIPYAGKPLASNMEVHWKVQLWTEDGTATPWSTPARFTMGLLEAEDWKGPWIHHPDAATQQHIWFRRNLTLEQPAQSALIHIASLGYHELFINGEKVADHHLAPAASRLDKRVLYLTYDIAHLLRPGENTIAIWHGPGWAQYRFFRTRPSLRIQMDATLADGQPLSLASDASWRCAVSSSQNNGGWRYANMGGEQIDARLHHDDWNLPNFDDSQWQAAAEKKIDVTLSAQMMEPTRVIKTIPAQSVARHDDAWRFDMGKNFTGFLKVNLRGLSEGDEVLIQVANREGEVEDFHQRALFFSAGEPEETFRHRFNYIAGRYVTITGLKSEPRTEDVTGVALSTDVRRTGSFTSSNDLYNRIYEADLWTWRANLTEGFTADCPHRERLGYGEVAFACAWGIAFPNYDSSALYMKHVRDWSDVQRDDGSIHHTAPQINTHFGGPMWSSAGLNIAWAHYQAHGDRRILELTYPASRRWLEFLNDNVEDGLLKKYNENWGRFLGEWAAPDHVREEGDPEVPRYFNNCVYAMNLATFVAIAEVLGHEDDATFYRERLESLRQRIHERYFNPEDNTYSNGRQVPLAFALLTGVPPEELRPTIEESFQRELRAKTYLDMGSSGLPVLLNYLTQHASCSLPVYDHLNSATQPSYGYFLERGENTWPEYWTVDVPSRIHTCYTGIASWFMKSVAGIRPDPESPGYQQFLIQPVVGGDLTFAEGQTESSYGTIRSRWQREGDRLTLEVTVPPNSHATIHLPTHKPATATVGGKPLAQAPGIDLLEKNKDHLVLRAGAGKYRFESHYHP